MKTNYKIKKISLERATKTTACLVVSAFLFTTVSAPFAQANIWDERREALRKAEQERSKSDAPLLAQLPSGLSGVQGASLGELNGLIPNLNLDIAMEPGLAAQGAGQAASQADIYKLPPALIKMPFAYGTIRKVRLSENPSAPLVILIQDAHEIASAQKNIAAMLNHLEESFGKAGEAPMVIGVEGSVGGYDLGRFRNLKARKAQKTMAQFLLEKSFINGAEYHGMTAEAEPLLWGIESEEAYLKNVSAYRKGEKSAVEAEKTLNALEASLEPLKQKFLSPELLDFDRAVSDFNRGKITVSDFFGRVARQKEAKSGRYPEMEKFYRALELEKSLDFKKVESERAELIGILAKKLSKENLSGLLRMSLAYRLGRIGYSSYYQYLKGLMVQAKADMGRYREFDRYIQYAVRSEKIDPGVLNDQLEKFKQEVAGRLSGSPEQKALADLSGDLGLVGKLFKYELNPMEWGVYSQRKKTISQMPRSLEALGGEPAVWDEKFQALLAAYEEFYAAAENRNRFMIENLLSQAAASAQGGKKVGRSVMLAGGFHAVELEKIFESRGISYVTLMPKIGEIKGGGAAYLQELSETRSPIEKMLLGDKLMINPTSGIAKHVVAGFEHLKSLVNSLAALIYGPLAHHFGEQDLDSIRKEMEALIGEEVKIELGNGQYAVNIGGKKFEVPVSEGPVPTVEGNQPSLAFQGQGVSLAIARAPAGWLGKLAASVRLPRFQFQGLANLPSRLTMTLGAFFTGVILARAAGFGEPSDYQPSASIPSDLPDMTDFAIDTLLPLGFKVVLGLGILVLLDYLLKKAWAGVKNWIGSRTPRPAPLKTADDVIRALDLPLNRMGLIGAGLMGAADGALEGRQTSLAMRKTFAVPPTGKETGHFITVDWGGTNLRVHKVELLGDGRFKEDRELLSEIKWEDQHKALEGKDLFKLVAGHILEVVKKDRKSAQVRNEPAAKDYRVGFVFSFDMDQKAVDSALITVGTSVKGFKMEGLLGQDAAQLLDETLFEALQADAELGDKTAVQVAAVVNDTVGTQFTAAYRIMGGQTVLDVYNRPVPQAAAVVGLIAGTGHNMSVDLGGLGVFNMEAGNYDPQEAQTSMDQILDKARHPNNPGEGVHRLEKMLAGGYLGEVFRLAVEELRNNGFAQKTNLFKTWASSVFAKPYSLDAGHLSLLEEDKSADLSRVAGLAKGWGLGESTIQERLALQGIARAVVRRSARLAAATTLGAVRRSAREMGDVNIMRPYVVAVDGSLYEKYPGYKEMVQEALVEMLWQEPALGDSRLPKGMNKETDRVNWIAKNKSKAADNIYFVFSPGGTAIGGAIIAATAQEAKKEEKAPAPGFAERLGLAVLFFLGSAAAFAGTPQLAMPSTESFVLWTALAMTPFVVAWAAWTSIHEPAGEEARDTKHTLLAAALVVLSAVLSLAMLGCGKKAPTAPARPTPTPTATPIPTPGSGAVSIVVGANTYVVSPTGVQQMQVFRMEGGAPAYVATVPLRGTFVTMELRGNQLYVVEMVNATTPWGEIFSFTAANGGLFPVVAYFAPESDGSGGYRVPVAPVPTPYAWTETAGPNGTIQALYENDRIVLVDNGGLDGPRPASK